MPGTQAQAGLERVVVRVGGGLNEVHVEEAEPGEKGVEGPRRAAVAGGLRVVAGDELWRGLIDVAIAEEFAARRAHVTHLPDREVSEFVLDVQVVVFHIGRARVPVHGKHVRRREARRREYGLAGLNLAYGAERKRDRVGAHAVVRRARIEGIERELAQEEVL